MHTVFLILITLLAWPAQAGFYKWVDATGQVHYGDRPSGDAEQVRVPGAAPHAEAPGAQGSAGEGSMEYGEGEYGQFEIIEPAAGSTLRSDRGEVSVSMIIEPMLQAHHHIRLKLDGQTVQGLFNSTNVVLRQVPLGSHRLQATVIDDEEQEIAASNSISFHMRRPSESKPAP